MKRVVRKTETFDALELYTALSHQKGYRIDVPSDINAFQQQIGASLKATLSNPNILHGKRVESMFAHVLGAMGECQYIKQEDSGVAFSSTDNFIIPDYRVVTSNGDLLLIEVKNFHMKALNSRFTMKKSYLKKLVAYSEINRAPLKIAIYFSRINKWALLSPSSFFDDGHNIYIDLPHAMARNEMSLVGECMVATLPPLRIEFFGDAEDEKAKVAEDGTALFTIREIKMSCAGKPITDVNEQRLAFYLMRYGNWSKTETPATIDSERLISFAHEMEPENPSEEQPFQIIGDLSSMISTAFRELTVDDQTGVVALDVKYDPESFSFKISRNYKGEALPLWRFEIQPNFDFKMGA
ncbi:TPA: hypothetical protein PXM13_000819 [Yersinia enterocolitica]|uniref:hypothetical protein n=1 Tax=Serratia proteamaculans TaxID=28151 RepID=UPI0015A1EB46|nr:hypothetical protein [Serratia proteamaculans]NWA73932.1 hypothetical protein [Serratia proteamaculans]HDL6936382.1 hypothetical protein [Yersinia enterocolitica]